ncbi:hypothetical protein [Shewanella litorisediminis]|uniref:Lipoprotein n=1 Tax=Shewanella litorisediminis TaxID=1173586 RepID=A0ABX7G2S1_9GAMM|nr:hypothetical protein [Shewanella litorisediminis]MCL2917056.1 hypothetical protein [Shewanella litorisediminis]QRH01537.1 hypothetical protein JQC75_17075 [Shewanella litorisediminis]
MIRAALVLITVLLVGACTQADQWTLAFRAAPSDAPWQFSEVAGHYHSLEQCQAKGDGLVRLGGDKGQYLCAQQCEAQQGELSCALLAPSTSSPIAQESQ